MTNYCKKFLLIFAFSAISCRASLLWNIQTGINLFNGGNYQNSKEYFINYLANNPNDEQGYYYLARTYLKLKDKVNASKNFEKSYNLTAKNRDIEKINFKNNHQLLNDYFDMAVMYYENANFQEAEFYADLMLKLNNRNSNAWFLKAKIANSEGKKEEAVESLNKAILYNNKLLKTNLAKKLDVTSVPPVSKEDFHKFAFEDYYRGNIEGAVRNCLKYIEFDNTNNDTNILLAELYLIKNEPQKALEIIENAKKTTQNTALYLIEAKIYENLKEFEKQENALLKAYKINPNNSQMLYNLGNFYLKKEDYKKSIKYFEVLINTDDSYYEGYFGCILSLIELGKTDSAVNYIRKASNLNPNQSEISYLLSLICFKQGQMKEAKDYIEEALSKQSNPNYLLLKAQISYYSGKFEESLAILNEIQKTGEKVYNPKTLDEYYIKNYLKLKKYQNAQNYFNKPDTILDKNSLLYKYNLYQIYKLEGNDKKANIFYSLIKSPKYSSSKEYINLSEMVYEKEGLNKAIKLLDTAIKKFDEPCLYFQKVKIYFLAQENSKIKEVLDEISKKFN